MNPAQFIAKSEDYWGPYPVQSAGMVMDYLETLEDMWHLDDLFRDLQFSLPFKDGPPSIADIMDVISDKAQDEPGELKLTVNEYPGTEDLMPSLEDDLEIRAADKATTGEHVGHVGDGSAEVGKEPVAATSGSKKVLEK